MMIDLMQAVRRVLAANDIQLITVERPFDELHKSDYGLRDALDPQFDWSAMGCALLEEVPERTLLLVEDMFGMRFFAFRMPDEEGRVYMVGPWRVANPQGQKDFRDWLLARTSQEVVRTAEEFYNAVYLLPDENGFAGLISALLSAAFPHMEGRQDFHIETRKEFLPLNYGLDDRHLVKPNFAQDIPMALLEERYQNENEMMEAVAQGDTERALALLRQRKRFRYSGNRFQGSLQQERMASVILNVLLRKAIERAQVHPYYIDQISAQFYNRIQLAAPGECPRMQAEMIANYCRYAQEYSMQQYSPLIKKTINYINLNLASPLSLRVLAEQFFISPSYLSNLFRTEVGVTLVDYINTHRMKRAAGMLTETNLSITAIAEHVGIFDVNYFAKIFKKAYGMTPTLYRRSSREQNAKLAPHQQQG